MMCCAGDDTFVIVGDISAGGKVDSDEDTAALGFPLTDLNGVDLNEGEDGAAEIIRGGEGEDTLYVYGTADLSNYDITGIEHVEIRSDVTFSEAFLNKMPLRGNWRQTQAYKIPNHHGNRKQRPFFSQTNPQRQLVPFWLCHG